MTSKKVVGDRGGVVVLLIIISLLLSGCGWALFGGEPEPTPTVQRALVPTFTATPEGEEPTETPLPSTPICARSRTA